MSFVFSRSIRPGRALLVHEYTEASLRRHRPVEIIEKMNMFLRSQTWESTLRTTLTE